MGEYHVTYVGNTREVNHIRYQVDFLKQNRDGAFYRVFSAYPSIQLNERMGNVYEPYAKVFPFRDVFTYITFADVESDLNPGEPALLEQLTIAVNDTVQMKNNRLVLHALEADQQAGGEIDKNNIRIAARLEVLTHFGGAYQTSAAFLVRDGFVLHEDGHVADLDLRLRFRNVTDTPFTIVLDVLEDRPAFIVVKTVLFPFINLLWFSILVMLAGLLWAFRDRWSKRKGRQAV